MRFFVVDRGARLPYVNRPFAVLYRDNWNDFGFMTMFAMELFLTNGDVIGAGNVKITRLGLRSGAVDLPDVEFEALPESYCSLGQEYTYYELLAGAGESLMREVLSALRDVVLFPPLAAAFKNEPSFNESLIRFDSASRALRDAPGLLAEGYDREGRQHQPQKQQQQRLSFAFTTSVGGSFFEAEFRFADRRYLPSRINAVIGYNGTGKTRLLANLAIVASADRLRRWDADFQQINGSFSDAEIAFGAVVAISYSAFDIFRLPDHDGETQTYNYTYCGLRKRDTDGTNALKSQEEITLDFLSALDKARGGRQREILVQVFDQLRQEPSFARVELAEYVAGDDTSITDIRSQFERLSTGHKIVLNIATQLVANLQQRSLILIDEPESHLHPPLLAALIRALSEALDQRDSFAVVATHSPVVLQEVPARYVSVLRRSGDETLIEPPELETFGENVGFLTRTVFNLDSSATDHHDVLRRLAEFPIEHVEAMFGSSLGNQARAYLMKLQRERSR